MVDAPDTTPDIGGKLTRGVAEQLARNWWMLLLNGAVLSRGPAPPRVCSRICRRAEDRIASARLAVQAP
jgi:hypothetical protein